MMRCEINVRTKAASNFCEECEHVYFTPFLSEFALDKIYTGYRNSEYDEQRILIEPSYRALANEFTDLDSNYHNARRDFYDEFAELFSPAHGLVVDLGGGNGYFSRYAFPHADVVILERDYRACGINAEELLHECDYFFCAHVLQTSPSPVDLLTAHTQHLRSGTPAWIELPKQYHGSLEACFSLEEARSLRAAPPQGALRQMHENLNHFSLKSARRVAEKANISVDQVIRTNIGVTALFGHVAARSQY
jgi:hypothetical protein